jgi:Tol biopolymer transport system component
VDAHSPVFSPDKRYLLFLDKYGSENGDRVVLMDLETRKTRRWVMFTVGPDTFWVAGYNPVWDLNQQEFYIYRYYLSFTVDIIHVNIRTNESSFLTETPGSSEGVVGMKDANTLIVLTNDTPKTGGPPGYYYMTKQGEYAGMVENSYLRLEYDDNHVSTRLVSDLQYYPDRQLFVFALTDSTFGGKVICISDFMGTYIEVLTHGYSDGHPTLNTIDNSVYFERKYSDGSRYSNGPIMKVDLDTKRVSEFFRASNIPGAETVIEPDF